ncbi:motility associated factor glycosyltransferase family protein [Leptospira sp. SA-E8]|uniref:motility associated factor glycosyltransferase family protein n=1 Tax=Leptospira sp. SA-E8 TaxID=3422259 RepID=UPI003EB90C61
MKEFRSDLLEKNLASLRSLAPEASERIGSSQINFEIVPTKTEDPSLKIGNVLLHSSMDPRKEAERQLADLKKGDEDRAFLFFGAGLGYSIQYTLGFDKIICVWMEPFPEIIKAAFSLFDFSTAILSGKLRIFLSPYEESAFYEGFKGISGYPVSFIPHRGSLQWKKDEYQELRFLAETFFHKKDVNTATLTRFEKVWTGNFIRNLPELVDMSPINELFGLCKSKVDVVVCGAGPSLYLSLQELKEYRENFILIAVDTALLILQKSGIDPDLVFSVDPQPLNSKYLEGYFGKAKFIFDPTTSYHSLRMPYIGKNHFLTSSPFPWIKLLENVSENGLGAVDFGGSVSTNATSLAEKMDARSILLLGQDLSFPGSQAHCKGAILEERLNFLESRIQRREHHNYKQMTALPPKWIESIQGKKLRTNEKLLIFKKWFEERQKDRPWANLGKDGAKLEGIQNITFQEWFKQNPSNTKEVSEVKEKIRGLLPSKINGKKVSEELSKIRKELKEFGVQVSTGEILSEKIYALIQNGEKDKESIRKALHEISVIDDRISSKKGLTEFLGISLQRVILAITEGYDTELTLEEKKNERLAVAKKSLLLYSGLKKSTEMSLQLINKAVKRFSRVHNL